MENSLFNNISKFPEFKNQILKFKSPIEPVKKKKDKKTLLINGVIVTGTTLTGAGIAGVRQHKGEFDIFFKTPFKKLIKNSKKFNIFAKEKFKEIAKNSREHELIYMFKDCGLLPYFNKIKKYKKELKNMSYNSNLDFSRKLRKINLELAIIQFDSYVASIKNEFGKTVIIKDKIAEMTRKTLLGAAAGLAVGLSIIGIKHLVNKNKENLSKS